MSRRLENYSKEDAQERKRLIEKIDTHPSWRHPARDFLFFVGSIECFFKSSHCNVFSGSGLAGQQSYYKSFIYLPSWLTVLGHKTSISDWPSVLRHIRPSWKTDSTLCQNCEQHKKKYITIDFNETILGGGRFSMHYIILHICPRTSELPLREPRLLFFSHEFYRQFPILFSHGLAGQTLSRRLRYEHTARPSFKRLSKKLIAFLIQCKSVIGTEMSHSHHLL
jgi:hypothetical protein